MKSELGSQYLKNREKIIKFFKELETFFHFSFFTCAADVLQFIQFLDASNAFKARYDFVDMEVPQVKNCIFSPLTLDDSIKPKGTSRNSDRMFKIDQLSMCCDLKSISRWYFQCY